MAETLYQIIDEFPARESVTTYHGLTLKQAAIRMDDLIDVSERVIVEDWAESCPKCDGSGHGPPGNSEHGPIATDCPACNGDGKWPGPWEHTDEETGREVTMSRVAP